MISMVKCIWLCNITPAWRHIVHIGILQAWNPALKIIANFA